MSKTKASTVASKWSISLSPRVRALLRRPDNEYLGVCIVQAPGAWSRMGPTWLTARGIWICCGPGLGVWGTTLGLAELAHDITAKPTWHACAAGMCPQPNLVFAVSPEAAEHHGFGDLDRWAEQLMQEADA